MALDQKLRSPLDRFAFSRFFPGSGGSYEEVCKLLLDAWMQMQLWLLHDDGGISRRIETLGEHRQNLRHPETDVRQEDSVRRASHSHTHLVLRAIASDRNNLELAH